MGYGFSASNNGMIIRDSVGATIGRPKCNKFASVKQQGKFFENQKTVYISNASCGRPMAAPTFFDDGLSEVSDFFDSLKP